MGVFQVLKRHAGAPLLATESKEVLELLLLCMSRYLVPLPEPLGVGTEYPGAVANPKEDRAPRTAWPASIVTRHWPSAPPGPGQHEQKGGPSPSLKTPPQPLCQPKRSRTCWRPHSGELREEKERRGPGLSYATPSRQTPPELRPHPQPRQAAQGSPGRIQQLPVLSHPAPVGGGEWRAWGPGPAGHIPWQAAPGTGGPECAHSPG